MSCIFHTVCHNIMSCISFDRTDVAKHAQVSLNMLVSQRMRVLEQTLATSEERRMPIKHPRLARLAAPLTLHRLHKKVAFPQSALL